MCDFNIDQHNDGAITLAEVWLSIGSATGYFLALCNSERGKGRRLSPF
jgi:hypothetical protein